MGPKNKGNFTKEMDVLIFWELFQGENGYLFTEKVLFTDLPILSLININSGWRQVPVSFSPKVWHKQFSVEAENIVIFYRSYAYK